MMLCAGQGGNRQRQGMGGHLVKLGKAAVMYLLVAANLIQRHDFYGGRVAEIRHGWVVESDVAVLPNPHENNINGRLCQQGGVAGAFGGEIRRVAV